jgi:cobalt-precorrin-5B (C1)-methyltransferase
MIRDNILAHFPDAHLVVTISIPQGEEIARRTFNPRLGIVGGISVVGVSGIIKPFSKAGFLDSIKKCMQVAKASGCDRVVINSGAKSERFVKVYYPALPSQVFVEYGNYIGDTIRMASELHFPQVTLGVMLGKAVKLAAGNLDTHSKKTVMDKSFVLDMLREVPCDDTVIRQAEQITLARELWKIIPESQLQRFAEVVIKHCYHYCAPLLPKGQLTILLIDEEGNIYHS